MSDVFLVKAKSSGPEDLLARKLRQLLRVAEDHGFMASRDPVAIDQSAYDLTVEKAGRILESMSYQKNDGTGQMAYAEKMGLGTREYRLIEVAP